MIKSRKLALCIKLFAVSVTALLFSLVSAASAMAEGTGHIELSGGQKIDWPCGVPFTDPGWEATNSQGEDCSALVTATGEVRVWKTGRYTIRYSFTDGDGKYFETRRTVNVVPVEQQDETKPREKVIYMTFDDGPCEYTDRVLELLDMYDAKATFFVIGSSARSNRDRIEKIISAGHQLGIHARNHDYGALYSSEEYFFEDFMSMQELLYEYTGSYATVSRFPGGSETAYQFMDKRVEGGFDSIKQRFDDMGVRYFDWNIQVEGEMSTGMDMYYFFKNQVPLYETPMCLQHDTLSNSVNALERLLVWGTENGYTFAAIDESTPDVQFR